MGRIKIKHVLTCIRCARSCDLWNWKKEEGIAKPRRVHELVAKMKHCYACCENWDMKMSEPIRARIISKSKADPEGAFEECDAFQEKETCMSNYIEIQEGHNPLAYFWIRPVNVVMHKKKQGHSVMEYDEEISILEEDIDRFLEYFFEQYFEPELLYNARRYQNGNYVKGFEWYLTDNFYTYECMDIMLGEIEVMAELLEADYENDSLKELKKHFRKSSPWYENINYSTEAIINFYRRFVTRMRTMMKNNPETNFISIMGP